LGSRKQGENGQAQAHQPQGRGSKSVTQLIQDAARSYQTGTPSQVRQLISNWETELNQQAEAKFQLED